MRRLSLIALCLLASLPLRAQITYDPEQVLYQIQYLDVDDSVRYAALFPGNAGDPVVVAELGQGASQGELSYSYVVTNRQSAAASLRYFYVSTEAVTDSGEAPTSGAWEKGRTPEGLFAWDQIGDRFLQYSAGFDRVGIFVLIQRDPGHS